MDVHLNPDINATYLVRSLMNRKHQMIKTPPLLKTHLCTHILLEQHSFSRTTTHMGSPTLALLLSTWTTPSVLVLPLPQLQVLLRPQPQVPILLLGRAREHKRTGKALRKWPPHLPQGLSRLRSSALFPPAVPRASIVLLSFHILWSTELHLGPLSLAPGQGRARSPITLKAPFEIFFCQPAGGALPWPGAVWHGAGACWLLQRPGSG